MSGECGKFHEHRLDCKCDCGWVYNANPVKQIRLCVECGKSHDTGIENIMEGTFQLVDTCIDCLMSMCPFIFQGTQITLEDVAKKTSEEMHREIAEALVKILQKNYWNPPNEICDLPESEHGQTS